MTLNSKKIQNPPSGTPPEKSKIRFSGGVPVGKRTDIYCRALISVIAKVVFSSQKSFLWRFGIWASPFKIDFFFRYLQSSEAAG